jgi:hypothetical protein
VLKENGEHGTLWMRVGSDGRAPVWAQWPIWVHRRIPDAAMWKWVRVSVRRVGPEREPIWSCEITVDDPAPTARSLDMHLGQEAIAIEWCWEKLDDGRLRVARWADTRGASGDLALAAYDVEGISKPDGIRAVRDVLRNDVRKRLQRALHECNEPLPKWLADAAGTLHLWESHARLHDFAKQWRDARCDAARTAYEILDAWDLRDDHLWTYEANARRKALHRRDDRYRVWAARLAQTYRTVLLSDQDLSREARWGDEGATRFAAGCSGLRAAVRNAFGRGDTYDATWRDGPRREEDEREWCERARDAWIAEGAREGGMFSKRKEGTANAWAARKAKALEKRRHAETARKAAGKQAE